MSLLGCPLSTAGATLNCLIQLLENRDGVKLQTGCHMAYMQFHDQSASN